MRRELRHGCSLVDLDAKLLDERGQAEQQLHGVHPRDMGGEARAERPRDPDSGRELRCAELAEVLLAEAEAAGGLDLLAQPHELGAIERDREVAAQHEVGVDRVLGGHGRDLRDGREHRPLHRFVGRDGAAAGVGAWRSREEARHPATVAARGAETGLLGLQHEHPQRRTRALQVVRGPEARETGADDRHVGLRRTGQRWPRRRLAADRTPPEAQFARPHFASLAAPLLSRR